MPLHLRVAIEAGKKKSFATALDWPGWSRSGKTTDEAIAVLFDYRERYNDVVGLADLEPLPADVSVTVVDQTAGDATTDFGVPGKVIDADFEPLAGDDLARQAALLRAAWTYLDGVAAEVSPQLRKGPRGGGRDRDRMLDHVIRADRGYARKIGVRTPPFDSFDAAAVQAHHEAVFAVIDGSRIGGEPAGKGWPLRYAIRRMAWHALDHAWEMQDKDLS
jgi:hypothetical protein